MSRWTYYSPAVLGVIFALALQWNQPEPIQGAAAVFRTIGIGLLIGLMCQTFMLGCQGMGAQAMPVPGGKTLRGSGAAACGAAILFSGAALTAGAVVLGEGLRMSAYVLLIAGGGAALVAGVIYFWGLPMAQRDFAERM